MRDGRGWVTERDGQMNRWDGDLLTKSRAVFAASVSTVQSILLDHSSFAQTAM